jgi:hypothetical protein
LYYHGLSPIRWPGYRAFAVCIFEANLFSLSFLHCSVASFGDLVGRLPYLHPQTAVHTETGFGNLGRPVLFSSPSGSIKGDVKKKHSSSSARRGYFSDIQPPSADARILAEARLGEPILPVMGLKLRLLKALA